MKHSSYSLYEYNTPSYRFNKGGLYICNNGSIVLCTQSTNKPNFYGTIVYHKDIDIIGEYAMWPGEQYSVFNGSVTLEN